MLKLTHFCQKGLAVVNISASKEHLWILLVGLHTSECLPCHLLELALITSNSSTESCHLLCLFVSHSPNHKDDQGLGLPLAISLRNVWEL